VPKSAQNTHLTAEPILEQCAFYGSRPPIASKAGSSPPTRYGLNNITSQPWSDATCSRITSDSAYFPLCHTLLEKKDKTKYQKRSYGGRLRQTMVNSWYCLERVVPNWMSQVWRRSEVGNHRRRTLNTRLSSGTSEHTSSSSRNVPGRLIWSDLFWYWDNIKTKPTYRGKFQIFFVGRFRSTLKPILGNHYVRSWGFILSEPREMHPRSEIADVLTSPCPPLDNLGCPHPHPPP